MTILVETGAGIAGANSYNTLAEMRAYALSRGVTLDVNDGLLEIDSNLAMDYMESRNLKGTPVDPGVQTLSFPRYDMYCDGYSIPSTEIPAKWKLAQIQLIMEIAAGIDLDATYTNEKIKSKKVDVLETVYQDHANQTGRATMTKVNNLLKCFVKGGSIDLTITRV